MASPKMHCELSAYHVKHRLALKRFTQYGAMDTLGYIAVRVVPRTEPGCRDSRPGTPNLLRSAVLAGYTPQSASGRLTTVGNVLPAVFGPAR